MKADDAIAVPEHPADPVAPQPGSKRMPHWEVGELADPPVFRWRNWWMLIGPGLVMGASAIGGGEWLTGPVVTARYGGAVLWLATLSILGQVLYNIEVSRYTLYCGEPIFAGKFRTLPGPGFWLVVYLILDFGSVLPYLASNAAVPLIAMVLGRMPDPQADVVLIKGMACGIFLSSFVPLIFGGKIYSTLKVLMTFKLIFVVGFLLLLAILFSRPSTWVEIFGGFFRFGTLPLKTESGTSPQFGNAFSMLWGGEGLSAVDLSMIGFIAAMAAIAGNGGLTNTAASNYTRDQGWGMGGQVGAIPSIVGGHSLKLAHVGKVFVPTDESLLRWRGWLRHLQRDQWAVWMPACFIGLALPSMLSVQFLEPGTVLQDKWLAAAMTSDGVVKAAGPSWGPVLGFLTLFCGFLVLITAMIMTADGVLRRWVDVFWIASPRMREWKPQDIGRFYFAALCIYAGFGLTMLLLVRGDDLVRGIGMIYNFAIGFSCFHTLAVNLTLLPRPLRPGWLRSIGLFLAGVFFFLIATLTTIQAFGGFSR